MELFFSCNAFICIIYFIRKFRKWEVIMKNRLIGTICAAVMLLALFAPMAMADGMCGESASWTLTDDGVLSIFLFHVLKMDHS